MLAPTGAVTRWSVVTAGLFLLLFGCSGSRESSAEMHPVQAVHPVSTAPCHGADDRGTAPSEVLPGSRMRSGVIRWTRPTGEQTVAELDRWCNAVGAPLVYDPGTDGPRSSISDGIAVISWNTNVGAADLSRFLADLRSGELTGTPPEHFVLLLQEVYRSGEEVPVGPAEDWLTPNQLGAPDQPRLRESIEQTAEREGLHLFYVPSMRNGHADEAAGGAGNAGNLAERGPEDRGNAILSTLPLSDLEAVELPIERQRRVALAATVNGVSPEGSPWSVRVASVHLDHLSRWGRVHRSLGAGRASHAEILIDAFDDEERLVVGGDFNTWFRGPNESAARLMREHFPLPEVPPTDRTHVTPFLPVEVLLDYLFFRLPEGWDAGYRVVGDWYDSDHRPLIGWVRDTQAT